MKNNVLMCDRTFACVRIKAGGHTNFAMAVKSNSTTQKVSSFGIGIVYIYVFI